MKTKSLSSLLCASVAACLLCHAPPTAAAEPNSGGRVIVDWSQQPAGEVPVPDLFEHARVTKNERQGRINFMVVDATTNPPSPFSSHRPALMAKLIEGKSAGGGLQIKPFINPPLQAWMEFELVLDDSSHMTLRASNESDSPDPGDTGGRRLFVATLRPDQTIALRVEPGIQYDSKADKPRYLSIPAIVPPGVPTRFVVVWDFKSDPGTIGFRVHGDWGGDPLETIFQFEVNPEAARRGLDAFTIGGNGFFGNVSVSAEE